MMYLQRGDGLDLFRVKPTPLLGPIMRHPTVATSKTPDQEDTFLGAHPWIKPPCIHKTDGSGPGPLPINSGLNLRPGQILSRVEPQPGPGILIITGRPARFRIGLKRHHEDAPIDLVLFLARKEESHQARQRNVKKPRRGFLVLQNCEQLTVRQVETQLTPQRIPVCRTTNPPSRSLDHSPFSSTQPIFCYSLPIDSNRTMQTGLQAPIGILLPPEHKKRIFPVFGQKLFQVAAREITACRVDPLGRRCESEIALCPPKEPPYVHAKPLLFSSELNGCQPPFLRRVYLLAGDTPWIDAGEPSSPARLRAPAAPRRSRGSPAARSRARAATGSAGRRSRRR